MRLPVRQIAGWGMLAGVFASVYAAVSWVQGPLREKEYQTDREVYLETKKGYLEDRSEAMAIYLRRLESDSAFVARVARENLGLIREGEVLFTFDETPVGDRYRFPDRNVRD